MYPHPPGIPREIMFNVYNVWFRAVLVSGATNCSVVQPCCICNCQMNNLDYYVTDPPLFNVHVACAVRIVCTPRPLSSPQYHHNQYNQHWGLDQTDRSISNYFGQLFPTISRLFSSNTYNNPVPPPMMQGNQGPPSAAAQINPNVVMMCQVLLRVGLEAFLQAWTSN